MSTSEVAIRKAKNKVRESVWRALERHHVVEPGVAGHIPAFDGAEVAAELLTTMLAWKSAQVINSNPDRAQLAARIRALQRGKTVYMAVPNLAEVRPFYRLDPARLPPPVAGAALHQTAARVAPTVAVDEMPVIDLVLCGSVAVNTDGARVGKGAGYSDIELALLSEAGLITQHTVIVTTVHPLQVIDGSLPEDAHDFRVDAIVTPEAIIECHRARRPGRLIWEKLTPEKMAAIPALADRASHA